MDDLRDLYQSTILDHYKSPRNFGAPPDYDRDAEGYNPLCGDRLTVYLDLDGDRVADVHFEGNGCAISTASASLMTEFVKGKSLDEIETDFGRFQELVTTPPSEPVDTDDLGKLAVFSGVREYPMRVKCATLSWHTLKAALEGGGEVAKTE